MIPLTVMTFNIRGAYFDQPSRHVWTECAPLSVALIRKEAPDLIGFQEFQQGDLESFQEALPEYGYTLGFPIGESNSTGQPVHNTIFWRTDRLELLATGSSKALVLLDEPMTMKRVLVNDDTLPALVLRVEGEVHAVSPDASEVELLELLDDLLSD